MESVYALAYQALMEPNPGHKCQLVEALHHAWCEQTLLRCVEQPVVSIEIAGRPDRPQLVDPRKVPRRSLASEQGRKAMLHAIAHIEFNAINLALDAVYRFRDLPDDYVGDWLSVARDEARHFQLVDQYLLELGSGYGDFSAHNGLWDMACKTDHDVLHRMALVPRVMEARGLDVTPGLMARFRQAGDARAEDILQVIYQEEIGHVAIGNRWYQHCCKLRGVEPEATFRQLLQSYLDGPLRGPFNHPARISAGFSSDELRQLENSL
jgi:uncharacterized ferritin-like protein (DUF455 family)